ncbi:hypothetical protein SAMN05428944_2384 [Streptomyces sp. 1222.5]|uniref:hypothetical protein n=1 Tax=unclassified Streptomyces TaxID=2593676 RepID=UPI00089460E0|nr:MULTISPECIES: hypothetical protein [unclassified Streptomyces]PKW10428.1 hypothetical protein BX260_5710 [Streptomyces sp. 5112.2]SEC06389.1 hypothetical protein SAMN05428944_2384 [Streptomyces sp. 1222.5]
MLPEDMVGGVSAANLEASGDALKKFVKRVDGVLQNLEKSPGAPTRLHDQSIRQGALSSTGGSFHEADALHRTFNAVHERLTNLSKTLHLQIEALGIAVLGAKGTFDNLEEDQRRRFWEIQLEIKQVQGLTGDKHAGGGNDMVM